MHQHPAVLPDLSVLENLQVALPRSVFAGKSTTQAAQRPARWGRPAGAPRDRVETLTLAEKHLLEIAKAFAVRPKLLVLDEPTAPLGGDAVALLFGLVRDVVAAGTSVVYITHRLAEVRELADRVTVLRDGRVRGTSPGRRHLRRRPAGADRRAQARLDVPAQARGDHGQHANFVLADLTGPGFVSVSASAGRGEIIGVAGVVGNGQSELLRALAGLESFSGTVQVEGKPLGGRELLNRCAYMPADRHAEGLMMSLYGARERRTVGAEEVPARGIPQPQPRGRRRARLTAIPFGQGAIDGRAGRRPSRAATSRRSSSPGRCSPTRRCWWPTSPPRVSTSEPVPRSTGSCAKRRRAACPVVVASSDAKELEGLCDQVLVMSRGHVVETLRGDEVTEQRIVSAAVDLHGRGRRGGSPPRAGGERTDAAPVHAGRLRADGAAAGRDGRSRRGIAPGNERYLSGFNIANILTAATAIGLIALGQNIALLTGGIDLSVGPLAGFLVVVASFFVNDGKSAGQVILGIAVMVGCAVVVGLANGSLIRFGKFTPIAATLTLYIALGGFAFLLRSTQGGFIALSFQDAVNYHFGPIPAAFIGFVALTLAMEFALRRRPWGWQLRAVGSNEDSARRIGISINRTIILAYVASSLCVVLGALMLMAQYGIGDPSQGPAFTLTSVTAVVLGGTSLLGGRGTFVGTLMGAVLLQQLLNATTFLGLGSTSQYYFQGLLILVAAVVYTLVRSRRQKQVMVT